MLTFISRGQGYLAPLLLLLSVVFMIPSHEIGVKVSQSLAATWMVASGVWVAWYGRRRLLAAADDLGRPLRAYEWVFDVSILKPKPFHSFMFIQMPWWALAYGASAFLMLRLILG